MPDEMPFDIGGQHSCLGGEFLRTVFAEGALAGGVGFEDGLCGFEFGNCHQLDG